MDCYIVYRKGLVANMKKILSGQIKYEVRSGGGGGGGGGGGASYFPLFLLVSRESLSPNHYDA